MSPDAFLHHDRAIVRPADDPVFRVINGRPRAIRQGRGLAPVELELPFRLEKPVLAVGAHMKNTVALAWDKRVVVSPHIGEMDSLRSLQTFEQCIGDLEALVPGQGGITWSATRTRVTARAAGRAGRVCRSWMFTTTMHTPRPSTPRPWLTMVILVTCWCLPGMVSAWARTARSGVARPSRVSPGNGDVLARFRSFKLPGGERAGREPWRSAAAICWESGRACPLEEASDPLLYSFWQQGKNAPQTTAAGRLFDAASALCGVCTTASYEGQGPMQLEALAARMRHF